MADGNAALAAIARRRPTLLLTDAMMPGLDGFGLLRQLRQDLATRSIPVIMLSARAGEESRVSGLEAGADDYIVKPFSARELLARVSTRLEVHRLGASLEQERAASTELFAQTPVPVAILRGEELIFELVNPAFATAMGDRDLRGKPVLEGMPELAGQGVVKLLHQVLRTGEAQLGREMPVKVLRNGQLEDTCWNFIYSPLRNAGGAVERVIAICHEITEQVEARRKLRVLASEADAANRAKDEFLAMLGHELRNPLTPILTTIQWMRLQGGKAFVREREVIERHARQLAGLVDDLMDTARIAQGKVKLSRKRVDLAGIVSKAVEAASPLFEERGHELHLDVPDGLVVNADESRMVQVASNLLTNAAKYTAPGGRIEVVATRVGPAAVLRVRDDGIGISSDLLPYVFERFRQGDRGSARSEGGLGLGLSIVRNLVELHGGAVTATSAGAGKGSEFTVSLPRARARHSNPKPRSKAPPRVRLTKDPQAVLLVDDNRDIADVLAHVLRGRGHTVEVAYDGPSALEVVGRFRPGIALLDIGLPVMDGFELARRLKKRKGLGELKLLAVSGYGQPSDRQKARKAGFSDLLVKPIDVERLFAIIEHRRGH